MLFYPENLYISYPAKDVVNSRDNKKKKLFRTLPPESQMKTILNPTDPLFKVQRYPDSKSHIFPSMCLKSTSPHTLYRNGIRCNLRLCLVFCFTRISLEHLFIHFPNHSLQMQMFLGVWITIWPYHQLMLSPIP